MMRRCKKLAATLLALCLTASLLVPTASAATNFTFTMPEEPLDVSGSTVLTTMTQRAGSEINLIFGMNVVAGNSFNGLLNLAGTAVNENPDPYIWNFNYLIDDASATMPTLANNIRADAQPLADGLYYVNVGNELANANGLYASGGANQVYANPIDELGGVGYAVGRRVDVITGFNSLLIDQIDQVRAWKEGDAFYQEGDEDYSPLIIDVQTGSVTSRLYAWTEMGQAISAYLDAHPDKTVRYGDPYTLAVNLEQFCAGIPYYIASLIADGKMEKKTAAYVSAIDGYTLTCADPGTLGSVSADVYAQARNFNFLTGSYTLADLMDQGVDVIMLGAAGYGYTAAAAGGGQVDTAKQDILAELAEAGCGPDEVPLVMDAGTIKVTIGTNGFNYAPTTPLLVPYIQAYAYMDALAEIDPAVNPAAMFQYALQKFCHVKASAAADVALYYIGSNWDSMDEDYDQVPDLTGYVYDTAAIEKAIQGGIAYALSGRAEANGNTLLAAIRENDGAYLLLTQFAREEAPAGDHEYVTLTIGGKTKYLDLTDLAAAEGGDKSEQAENGGGDDAASAAASQYTSTRTEYQAIIDYYNSGEYGCGDDLQTTLQNYADRMVPHVWKPDTSVPNTYGCGLGSAEDAPADAPAQVRFRDVAETSWYAEYVAYVSQRAIMNGDSSGLFVPKGQLTRAEMCQILYNLAGRPDVGDLPDGPDWTDFNRSAWYASPVLWCWHNGIAAGRTDTEFAPNAAITREEVADFLYRCTLAQGKDAPAGDVSAFPDAADVSSPMADAMSWAVGAKIITGVDGRLVPGGTAARAEIAAMLMRFCESI